MDTLKRPLEDTTTTTPTKRTREDGEIEECKYCEAINIPNCDKYPRDLCHICFALKHLTATVVPSSCDESSDEESLEDDDIIVFCENCGYNSETTFKGKDYCYECRVQEDESFSFCQDCHKELHQKDFTKEGEWPRCVCRNCEGA